MRERQSRQAVEHVRWATMSFSWGWWCGGPGVKVSDEGAPEVRSARRRAGAGRRGEAQNRVWQAGWAKKRAVGCSNGSTRREKCVAGRAGMRAQALEMRDGGSACWQNVDGGLAARHGKRERPPALAVTWRGQCPPRSLPPRAGRRRREQHQTAATILMASGGPRVCIQTTRSTRLASERWATALESGKRIPPVECHQNQKATPRSQHRLVSNTKPVSRCLDVSAGSSCGFSAPRVSH
jgi:hypothetical protein